MEDVKVFERALAQGLESFQYYEPSLELIRRNSSGKIWLIGGSVYRTIAQILYGSPKPEVDFDFIVQTPTKSMILPEGWTIRRNRFGCSKFVNGDWTIDYVPLEEHYPFAQRNLVPTITNYLTCVPLTVQSIVYDVDEKTLTGAVGVDALRKKMVEINNLEFARYAAKTKGKSLEFYLQEIADSLRFRAILPTTK